MPICLLFFFGGGKLEDGGSYTSKYCSAFFFIGIHGSRQHGCRFQESPKVQILNQSVDRNLTRIGFAVNEAISRATEGRQNIRIFIILADGPVDGALESKDHHTQVPGLRPCTTNTAEETFFGVRRALRTAAVSRGRVGLLSRARRELLKVPRQSVRRFRCCHKRRLLIMLCDGGFPCRFSGRCGAEERVLFVRAWGGAQGRCFFFF